MVQLWLIACMCRRLSDLVILAAFPVIAACAAVPGGSQTPASDIPVAVPGARPLSPPVDARTVEDFDTTTAEDRAVALSGGGLDAEVALGRTIVSLGSPNEPGIWIETPLVSVSMIGRVEYPVAGTEIALELRPSGGVAGSGSEMSLSAMRLLEIPLTALAEVIVYAPGV